MAFKVRWTEIAQSGMPPDAVIKPHDITEYLGACLVKSGKDLIGAFAFKSRPETFHRGVIQAVAGAAHAGDDVMVAQVLSVSVAGVLAAAVGMMEQIRWWAAVCDRHVECGFHQFSTEVIRHRHPDNLSGEHVHDPGEIKIALLGFDVGDVSQPRLGVGALRRLKAGKACPRASSGRLAVN